jgi:hypothetical protein
MRLLSFVFLMLGVFSLSAQAKLQNGSFEGDEPQDATTPAGWHPCKEGTTPDILPGVWGVYTEASEGETFVGLITRDDGSYESIGQRLSQPLKTKECYELSIDLAHSKTYSGYNGPVKLRVLGGQSKCGRDQVIAISETIDHTDWETYSFEFVPKVPINYLIIEAHYKDGPFSHRGNILIDNIQPVKQCVRASLDIPTKQIF